MQSLVHSLRERFPDLDAIYLFGSAATGQATPQSDLDIALLAPEALDPLQLFDAGLEAARLLDREVDLVDLREASTVLAKEIVGYGRVLYSRDPAQLLDFEARVFSEYGHFRERTEFIRDAVRGDGRAYAP